jgi:hypothetical protein
MTYDAYNIREPASTFFVQWPRSATGEVALTDRVATRPIDDPLTGRQANRQRSLTVGLDELNRASDDQTAVLQNLIPNRGKIGALSLGFQAGLEQLPSKIHEVSGSPFRPNRRTGRSPEPNPGIRAGWSHRKRGSPPPERVAVQTGLIYRKEIRPGIKQGRVAAIGLRHVQGPESGASDSDRRHSHAALGDCDKDRGRQVRRQPSPY